MTKEALELALEALEDACGERCNAEYNPCFQREAITAIKEALAEQEPVAYPFEDKAVISSLSWAAGLIEQAYRACGGHNGADSWLMNYADKQGERIRQADHREWEKVNGRWQEKVTPPQRTWVGLDEEDNLDWEEGGNLKDLVKAIERKLKDKNTRGK